MDPRRPFLLQKTIEDLCCISGQRAPHAPPLPPDQTPNLESIQKVYDTAFAAGLDSFVETGSSKWFATQGFNHLVSDRELLGQFLLYLTIVSNNSNSAQPENALVASQEARITWALLNLVMKPAHDGNEEAEKIARRIKAVEALLTGEPSLVVRGSMADFIYQEDGGSESEPTPAAGKDTSSMFEKQLNRRSEDFWRVIEKFAEAPRSSQHNLQNPDSLLAQARKLLDGIESRDIVYSMTLLSTSNGQQGQITSRPNTSHGVGSTSGGNGTPDHHHQQEIALARRFLESQYGGRATNVVNEVLSGMASRAFQYE